MSTDIVIGFDTTGSMYSVLYEVRRKVSSLVDTLFREIPDLRIGIIANGDYCDVGSTYATKIFQLSNIKEDIIRFVNDVERTGGGDEDECYELVFNQVRSFDWSAKNKAFVLIADSEPHEVGYQYKRTSIVTINWRKEVQNLIDDDIKVYGVQCLAHYRKGNMYDTISRMATTPRLKLDQFQNITHLLTALAYRQQSIERVVQYGEYLKERGELNNDTARILNLLAEADSLVGGIRFEEEPVHYISRDGRVHGKVIPEELSPVEASRFQVLHVDEDISIKDFVALSGARFKIGKGFYELTKRETIQENKEVILQDRAGNFYTGIKAREIIGIPYGTRSTAYPNHSLGYTVYVQSTSANRKLMAHTTFLYEVE